MQYLDEQGRTVLHDANEIHIPVGEPVVLELRSADVIHSFWVPHLSGKKDMVPGRTNLLRIEAHHPGRYGGVCAEYCGGHHALMGFVTVAHPAHDWEKWLAMRKIRESAAAPSPRSEAQTVDAAKGEQLFMEVGCGGCHRVAGTLANGLAGPDLTHVGSRLTLGAGILPNRPAAMMSWIADSQSIKPGNQMPSFGGLSAEELQAISSWLEMQK